jgi:cytidine deaminase
MAKDAYSPYSNFPAGAVVLLEDGTIVGGNNQENRAFPAGLCAERVAIFSAAAQNKDKLISAVAIHANVSAEISPCGSCRQVILEYEEKQSKAIQIYLINGKDEVRLFDSAANLLPFAFRFNNFEKK